MTTPKITLQRLRKIITEEVRSASLVNESVDHKGISDIVAAASKLMAAIDDFKEKATPAATNAITPHLSEMEKVLENMVSSPGSYVASPKREPRRITLKQAKV